MPADRPAVKSRTDTAERILDLAETLIQTRGYNAFSYQDIADAMGIRKAGIHYHFASKKDLGVAVIDRYARRFEAMLAELDGQDAISSMAMLDHYTQPYLAFSESSDRVCLCGALAGEILALPEEMRAKVERFFEAHQRWLAMILERGARRGEFRLSASPEMMARTVFGALQGALIVQRATGDATQLKDVVAVLKAQIAAGA